MYFLFSRNCLLKHRRTSIYRLPPRLVQLCEEKLHHSFNIACHSSFLHWSAKKRERKGGERNSDEKQHDVIRQLKVCLIRIWFKASSADNGKILSSLRPFIVQIILAIFSMHAITMTSTGSRNY